MISLFNRRESDKRKPYAQPTETDSGVASVMDDLTIPNYENDTPNSTSNDTQNDALDHTSENNLINETQPSSINPQVFAFMGASGGVGTTSLATQVAYELAVMCKDKKANTRRPKDPQVCLIDLDFEGGTCAYHLDLLPSLSIEDLNGSAERIDTTFTSALVSTHNCGVSLLAVPNTPNANRIINPHAVMAMLDAASQLYRYVVIDMPRYTQNWTPAIIGGSDFVGVLAELTISSLHMARDTLNYNTKPYADNTLEDNPNCHPILSKYERRSFKNTLRLNDAETVLGRDVISTVCVDPDTCREAINCGEPIGALRADSRYVKDSRHLIKKIFQSCEVKAELQSKDISAQSNNSSKKSQHSKAA